ncbi:TOBE domain-containing protein [Halorussus gelatinilyticus]|uniref:TOBE domain-containing protein n=1 Tax=Halorussus gelatinilyticus TaxID=2937524 RepID=A0A8U0IM53_9EURY|nr:TOBE domain-containing protein [Halorussus gelatinilyticus]UPW01462.1 TOBE domain-containing protein [Halorussus gelatinilyticus]
MDAGFEAHLRAGEVEFDASDADLLRAVDEEGSLNRAADALDRSYSRAHQRLTALEDALGPLVVRQRGGSGGGGSRLTDEARDLLARFERLRAEFTGTAEVEEAVLSGEVVARDGELATVETPAGRVRALAPPAESGTERAPDADAEGVRVADADADAVQVAVRADAVTLHAPDAAPAAEATSARNRFSGSVAAIDAGEQVARVLVDVGTDATLAALVTMSSVETLDLDEGSAVVASFKATATRASPGE